jgi:hypothetical protein
MKRTPEYADDATERGRSVASMTRSVITVSTEVGDPRRDGT